MNIKNVALMALAVGNAIRARIRGVFGRGEKLIWIANTAPGAGEHESTRTYLTDAAITTRHLLYKQGSDANHIAVLTGASDLAIGTVADEATAAEEQVAVKLLGKGSTTRMVSNGTVTAGAAVYQTAAGKVASSGTVIVGIALTAGSADGDIVEVADMNVSANAATPGIAASTFDANTILSADADNTPQAITIAAAQFVGRLTGGLIKGCSITEVLTELGGNSAPTGTGIVVRQTTPTLVTPILGIATGTSLAATGAITSSGATAGLGYATGAGGAVTQITDATTEVTLNKICGQITTVALTTAAAAEEEFTVTNSAVAATDVVAVGTTYAGAGTPIVSVKGIGAGSFKIVITNVHGANALNAVLVINFSVIKSVAA